MDLDLLFLGTAGSAPTASRGTSSTLLRRGGDRLLVDCGEGTQRQLLRSDAGLTDLEHVFLTHLHADHVLGLPGIVAWRWAAMTGTGSRPGAATAAPGRILR